MNEMSKATARRKLDPRFANRWFVGEGLDVGCGPDPMRKEDWPNVSKVDGYDVVLGHKDAQYLEEIGDQSYDFVVSSHCLEHVKEPRSAIVNWLRVLKPGGFIVCTIPEEFLYESGRWPSRHNPDHKNSFMMREIPIIPSSINIVGLLWRTRGSDIELIQLLTDGWNPLKIGTDQTLENAECAIEFVIRKQHPKLWV